MVLRAVSFAGHAPARDLAEFVNAKGIDKANIEHIDIFDGTWYLFYWE
jgi:hypothetical protein